MTPDESRVYINEGRAVLRGRPGGDLDLPGRRATRCSTSGSRTARAATLSDEDIEHYKKVVKALHETAQIMRRDR